MNIFTKETDILGKYDSERMQNLINLFYETVRKIKKTLGSDSYKLDKYLGLLFESINCKVNEDAAADGDSEYSKLYGICVSILDNDTRYQDHKFYQTAKDFISTHKLPYKEQYTLHEIYCVLLMPKFTDFMAKKYAEDLKYEVRKILDIIELRQDYEELANSVGNSHMETLNKLVKKLFIVYPVTKSYLKSISDAWLSSLLYRDPETSKQIFQLITEINCI